jgi:hypothetical protein
MLITSDRAVCAKSNSTGNISIGYPIELLPWIEPSRFFKRIHLRRLPEKKMPDCVGFLFAFKARKQAHSELCNC